MIQYRREKKFLKSQNTTMENYYLMQMSTQSKKFKSYESICKRIKEIGDIPDSFPSDIILQIISRLHNVIFIIHNKNFSTIEIDNTINPNNKKYIVMYCDGKNRYVSLKKINHEFVPVYEYPPSKTEILKKIYTKHSSTKIIKPIVEII